MSGRDRTLSKCVLWLRHTLLGHPALAPASTSLLTLHRARCGKMGASGHPSLTGGDRLAPVPSPGPTLPPWEGALLPHRHSPRPE